MKKIILASASPRRKELLSRITNDFIIVPSDADEIYPPTLNAMDVSLYLSNIKANDNVAVQFCMWGGTRGLPYSHPKNRRGVGLLKEIETWSKVFEAKTMIVPKDSL